MPRGNIKKFLPYLYYKNKRKIKESSLLNKVKNKNNKTMSQA